jgi:peroxiredoxin Q/BCP
VCGYTCDVFNLGAAGYVWVTIRSGILFFSRALISVMLNIAPPGSGTPAPEFTLQDAAGKKVSLSDFRGAPVIVYFYPEDDTPACTTQACEFSSALVTLAKSAQTKGVTIIGISPDSPESHKAFAAKHSLTLTLLSDTPGADGAPTVARSYGAYGEKSLYGKTYIGIIRSTFVIDSDGVVFERFMNVRVAGHVQRVMDVVKKLTQTGTDGKGSKSAKGANTAVGSGASGGKGPGSAAGTKPVSKVMAPQRRGSSRG